MHLRMSPSSPLYPQRGSVAVVAALVLCVVCAVPGVLCESSSTDVASSNSNSVAASSVVPLTFLVLLFLSLLLWCALHVCCDMPCCCCCAWRLPHCACLRCCTSGQQQSQVHSHLHADDVPLTHPILASPVAHLAPLIRPASSAPHYRPYKGSYRIGKNHHLQPFTLNLRFDYASSPRTMSGHGVDDGQQFTVSDAAFTVNASGEHRCVFVERFGDGSRYVFYGVWQAVRSVDERWSGFWLRESGPQQQGTFSFQFDEAADEAMAAARLAGETDTDGWMARRAREQLAARERRYIVLRGLEERKEATDGTATAARADERVDEDGRDATAVEMMERRLNRPVAAVMDAATALDHVTVDVAMQHDVHQ